LCAAILYPHQRENRNCIVCWVLVCFTRYIESVSVSFFLPVNCEKSFFYFSSLTTQFLVFLCSKYKHTVRFLLCLLILSRSTFLLSLSFLAHEFCVTKATIVMLPMIILDNFILISWLIHVMIFFVAKK